MRFLVVIASLSWYCIFFAQQQQPKSLKMIATLNIYRSLCIELSLGKYSQVKTKLSGMPQDCALPITWRCLLRNNRLTCYNRVCLAEIVLARNDISPVEKLVMQFIRAYLKEKYPAQSFIKRLLNWAISNKPESIISPAVLDFQIRSWLKTAINTSNYTFAEVILKYSSVYLALSSALHLAVNYDDKEMVQLLLKSGRCNIHKRNIHGNTPLHLVRSPEVAVFLLDAGCSVEAVNTKGQTPKDTVRKVFERFEVHYKEKKE